MRSQVNAEQVIYSLLGAMALHRSQVCTPQRARGGPRHAITPTDRIRSMDPRNAKGHRTGLVCLLNNAGCQGPPGARAARACGRLEALPTRTCPAQRHTCECAARGRQRRMQVSCPSKFMCLGPCKGLSAASALRAESQNTSCPGHAAEHAGAASAAPQPALILGQTHLVRVR